MENRGMVAIANPERDLPIRFFRQPIGQIAHDPSRANNPHLLGARQNLVLGEVEMSAGCGYDFSYCRGTHDAKINPDALKSQPWERPHAI